MRIIISPAKKMNRDPDGLPWRDLPEFLPQAQYLCSRLREMDYEALKALWKSSDRITAQNVCRLSDMDLRRNLTPAILSYEGIQYQYMAPNVFTHREFDYIQEHLRILSGFYGLLRPFDGVVPYRLEMQARLKTDTASDLYGYWGNALAKRLFSETDLILNLASREYSLCVSPYIRPGIRFITCVFGEEKDGRILEKGTLCKMARGEMVRCMAELNIKTPEEIRSFDRLNFRFDPAHSDESTYVFVKKGNASCSSD